MAEAGRRGQVQRTTRQDMVTDDAGSKGEECKEPLGGLAGLPWVVTPFPELGKAAQRAGLGHAPFKAPLGRSSIAFDPHVGRAGGRNQSHLQATIRRYIVEEKFQEMQNVCRGVTHLRRRITIIWEAKRESGETWEKVVSPKGALGPQITVVR